MDNGLAYGRVHLRAVEPEDLELLYGWENDTSLWESSNTRAPFSKHTLAEYLRHASYDLYATRQLRLIIETQEGLPVGAVDLYDIDLFHQRAGVGIVIPGSSDRRHGFASDALNALEQYAAGVAGLRQLFACVSEDNGPSISLFQKAGYQLTGIRKRWLNTLKGWKDEWFFQKMLV